MPFFIDKLPRKAMNHTTVVNVVNCCGIILCCFCSIDKVNMLGVLLVVCFVVFCFSNKFYCWSCW